MDALEQTISDVIQRLERIESAVNTLVTQREVKEWYTTDEIAELLERAPFTVREWCRLGRINASKREVGRGNAFEWIVSHEELVRIRNYGLLSMPRFRPVR